MPIGDIAHGRNTRYQAGNVPKDEEAVLSDLFERREQFEVQIDACVVGAHATRVRPIWSMTTDLVGNPEP